MREKTPETDSATQPIRHSTHLSTTLPLLPVRRGGGGGRRGVVELDRDDKPGPLVPHALPPPQQPLLLPPPQEHGRSEPEEGEEYACYFFGGGGLGLGSVGVKGMWGGRSVVGICIYVYYMDMCEQPRIDTQNTISMLSREARTDAEGDAAPGGLVQLEGEDAGGDDHEGEVEDPFLCVWGGGWGGVGVDDGCGGGGCGERPTEREST